MIPFVVFFVHVLKSFLQSVLIIVFSWLVNILARRNMFELTTLTSDLQLDVTEIRHMFSTLLAKHTYSIGFERKRVTISIFWRFRIITAYTDIWVIRWWIVILSVEPLYMRLPNLNESRE